MQSKVFCAALTYCLAVGTAAVGFSADIYAVCRLDPNGDNFLALREGPSSKTKMLSKLVPGTRLEDHVTLDVRGKWKHVYVDRHGGPAGWVYADYICLVEDH